VADLGNNRVVELTPSGVQSTLAFSSLYQPTDVAVDSSGDVFVSDSQNHRVVEMTPAGVQTTLGFTGLSYPAAVAVDSAGDVYVADLDNNRVVRLTPAGGQTTLGFAGLSDPSGVAVDSAGDVYVADAGNRQLVELPALQVAPSFTSPTAATFTEGSAGSFVATASGGPAPTFSETGTLPAGVTLASTGVLSGTPTQDGTYPIAITATNGIGSPATQSFTLTVDQPAAITSPATATFTKGVKGTFTPKATGFPPPVITKSGTLPAGVKFKGGKLSGTPTVTGTFPVTFRAHNGVGTDVTQSFTLKVLGFHVSNTKLPSGTRGVAYSAQMKALGGTAPLTWTHTTSLPSGLTLSSSGLVTGTVPTTVAAGTHTFKVRVTDSTLPTHQVATATVKITLA
jgi:hypothetical protein